MLDKNKNILSRKVQAGRRTYFIDVKPTQNNDYYIMLTESKKSTREDGEVLFEKHKVFLYKEDFSKVLTALQEAVNYVQNELMPDGGFNKLEDRQAHEQPKTNGLYPLNGHRKQ